MLLVKMPAEAGCRNCLIFTFIMTRVIFSMWFFAMACLMYFLMGYTVIFWFKKTVSVGAKGVFDELKIHKDDINTISYTIIEIFLCLVAAIQILFIIFFPIMICKYVSSHDDSFCKVFCSRSRGFFKWFASKVSEYYYPIAVIEEEINYVGEIDIVGRATSNEKFNLQEKIDDYIEERKK